MLFRSKSKVIVVVLIVSVLTGCVYSFGDNDGETTSGQESSPGTIDGPRSQREGSIVVFGEVNGEVLARQVDEDEFRPAAVGDVLMLNNQVRTMGDGRARLDFPNGTIVRVGPNSMFTMGVIAGEEENLFKRVFLEFGKLWVILSDGEMEIETVSGLASVQGSFLSVESNGITGEVRGTCLDGVCSWEVNGEIYEIGEGETFLVRGVDEPPLIGEMAMSDFGEWLEEVPEAVEIVVMFSGSIGDFVWEDTNNNGIQDEEEPGLPAVTVYLRSTEGKLIGRSVTDQEGFFLFEGVFTGDYYLEFLKPEGYDFTLKDEGEDDRVDSDANEDGYSNYVTLHPGEHRDDVDAGMDKSPVCPLTGLPMEDERLLTLRPLFLSQSKFPAFVRPLAGLSSSPVVFETVLDAGQTRLQALYYCGYPEAPLERKAGNAVSFDISAVRSARVFYVELAKIFGAGLIYSGASPEVLDDVLPYTCAFAKTAREGDIGSAGLDVSRLIEIAEACQLKFGNTDLAVWQFGPPPPGGEPLEKFLMHHNYSNQTRWIFDPSLSGYVRYQNAPSTPEEFSLSMDRLNEEPIVRQNVLILITQHFVLNSPGTIIDFQLTNHGGYGYLLRDGMKYRICWSTLSRDYQTTSDRYRPFLILDCDTWEPINLAVGKMWVNVVDVTTGFGWEGEYWRAWHYQPTYQSP